MQLICRLLLRISQKKQDQNSHDRYEEYVVTSCQTLSFSFTIASLSLIFESIVSNNFFHSSSYVRQIIVSKVLSLCCNLHLVLFEFQKTFEFTFLAWI